LKGAEEVCSKLVHRETLGVGLVTYVLIVSKHSHHNASEVLGYVAAAASGTPLPRPISAGTCSATRRSPVRHCSRTASSPCACALRGRPVHQFRRSYLELRDEIDKDHYRVDNPVLSASSRYVHVPSGCVSYDQSEDLVRSRRCIRRLSSPVFIRVYTSLFTFQQLLAISVHRNNRRAYTRMQRTIRTLYTVCRDTVTRDRSKAMFLTPKGLTIKEGSIGASVTPRHRHVFVRFISRGYHQELWH
jgi:hypothetical protein